MAYRVEAQDIHIDIIRRDQCFHYFIKALKIFTFAQMSKKYF